MRSPLAPWILYAIGTTARIAVAVTTGHFGYIGDVQSAVTTASGYQQLLIDLSLCAPLAVAATALQVYRERLSGARVTLIILCLAEIAFGAASGNKQGFVITILAVGIPFAAARRGQHKGLLAFAGLAVTALVFLLIVIPFNQSYRGAARSASGTLTTRQALEEAPSILGQTIETGNLGGVLSSSTNLLLTRIREIDSPAIIMQRTPTQIGFASPAQLVEAPIATLVPRAVWPSKPILDSGYQFGQTYFELPATVIHFVRDNTGRRPVPARRMDPGDRGDVPARLRGAVPQRRCRRGRQPAFHFPFRVAVPQSREAGGRLGGDARRHSRDATDLAPRHISHVPEEEAAASALIACGPGGTRRPWGAASSRTPKQLVVY